MILILLIALKCLAQDDLFTDELKALVEPINISYLKKNNFKSLQLSRYETKNGKTKFKSKGGFYQLINDSVLGEYWSTQKIKTSSNAKNYYKEDKSGNLYLVSVDGKKQYPSVYSVDKNGRVIAEKNQIGKKYLFYNDKGQLIKEISDTLNFAANKPYSINEYDYKDSLLAKKIHSVYDSGVPKPTTSDTLIYSYSGKGILTAYSHTKHSSYNFMGTCSIVKHPGGSTIDLIQPYKEELIRYKFKK